jgi:hypothetical protein
VPASAGAGVTALILGARFEIPVGAKVPRLAGLVQKGTGAQVLR